MLRWAWGLGGAKCLRGAQVFAKDTQANEGAQHIRTASNCGGNSVRNFLGLCKAASLWSLTGMDSNLVLYFLAVYDFGEVTELF